MVLTKDATSLALLLLPLLLLHVVLLPPPKADADAASLANRRQPEALRMITGCINAPQYNLQLWLRE